MPQMFPFYYSILYIIISLVFYTFMIISYWQLYPLYYFYNNKHKEIYKKNNNFYSTW